MYLAASSDPAPPGLLGHRVIVGDCDRNGDRLLWEAVGSGDAVPGYYFLLRHVSNRLLRADAWNRAVSLDAPANYRSAVMHWKVETIPGHAQPPPLEAVMEQFPDGAYVRLRSRVAGLYLRADEDGVSVFFRPHRGSLNAAWRVHQLLHLGTTRILLQNAAYGRYLSYFWDLPNSCHLLVQSVRYNDIQQQNLHWECEVHQQGSGIFCLVHRETGLTIPLDGTPLVVELIPSRRGPAPVLPDAGAQVGFFRRLVMYVQGDEYGNFSLTGARTIVFQGRSVSQLRAQLADTELVDEQLPQRIALCLWAGSHGRLIPLISDLPANNENLEVIVFESSSRAALGLQYPLVDAD